MEINAFRALSTGVDRARESGRKLVLVDDGGIMVRLLAGKAEHLYTDIDTAFEYQALHLKTTGLPMRIVEQTTRGITEFNEAKARLSQTFTLVNMARSEAKAYADRYIGPVVVRALERGLRNLGKGTLQSKKVCLIGYGVIGRWIAETLRLHGADVTVTDIDHEPLEEAAQHGFRVEPDVRTALKNQDVVLGCSGHTSLTYDDFHACSWGTVFASATSKAKEFFTKHIHEFMTRVWPLEPGQHGQGMVIAEGDRFQQHNSIKVIQWNAEDAFNEVGYYLLNNGTPINFDGEVNCVDPEYIQVTEAIKFEAIVQAVKSEAGLGLIDMELQRQQRAIEAQDKFVPGWRD